VRMMSFVQLSEAGKNAFYEFVKKSNPDYKQDYQEFIGDYGGETTNYGENAFIVLDHEAVQGCIGVVTKEIPYKGEAFIFSFYADPSLELREAAEPLLAKAMEVCGSAGASVIRAGVSPAFPRLHEVVKARGFEEQYRSIIMAMEAERNDPAARTAASARLRFSAADDGNKEEYREIHNSAFLNTPNGGLMSCEEMDELLNRNRNNPELAGLAVQGDTYVGIYDLEEHDGTGWINRIGIHERYWRQGFGREMLAHAADLLIRRGSRSIKLIVMSNNERAVRLYRAVGFRDEKTLSVWYTYK
jgi:ribosomal protein S18 acetylase RimI-like enzyme